MIVSTAKSNNSLEQSLSEYLEWKEVVLARTEKSRHNTDAAIGEITVNVRFAMKVISIPPFYYAGQRLSWRLWRRSKRTFTLVWLLTD
jgi:hypothetical protein